MRGCGVMDLMASHGEEALFRRLLSAVCRPPSRRRHVDAPGVDELSAEPGAGDYQHDS
jgi:hypothetical protein